MGLIRFILILGLALGVRHGAAQEPAKAGVRAFDTLNQLLLSVPLKSEHVFIIKGVTNALDRDGFILFYQPTATNAADGINSWAMTNVAGRLFRLSGVGGGGGTTINPDDGFIPYRAGAGSFSNSPFYLPPDDSNHNIVRMFSGADGTNMMTLIGSGGIYQGITAEEYFSGTPGFFSLRREDLGEQLITDMQLRVETSTHIHNADVYVGASVTAQNLTSGDQNGWDLARSYTIIQPTGAYSELVSITNAVEYVSGVRQIANPSGAHLTIHSGYTNALVSLDPWWANGTNGVVAPFFFNDISSASTNSLEIARRRTNILFRVASDSVFPNDSTQFFDGTGRFSKPTGGVTNVAVTVPPGLSVSGSPITNGGTIAITTALSGIIKGTGSGFTNAVSGTDYQPAGNYVTALTGDVTASGPGSAAATLANSGVTNGAYGSATTVPVIGVDAKGRVTGATNVAISIAQSQVTSLVSDLAGKQATGNYVTALTGDVTASGPGSAAATLANSGVTNGAYGSATTVPVIGVDAKGRVTGATNVAISIAQSQVTSLVSDLAGKQATGNYLTALTGDVTASGPGSAAATLANSGVSAGTYRSVTVDAKGRATSGTNPTTLSGYGLSDTSASLAAALTDETGTGLSVFSGSPTITNLIVSESIGSSGLTINGATQTASYPALTLNQTWNSSGTTFVGALLNVTNTASAAASALFEARTNSVPAFQIGKDGSVSFGGISSTNVKATAKFSGYNSVPQLAVTRADASGAAAVHAFWFSANQNLTDASSVVTLMGNGDNTGSGIGVGPSCKIGFASAVGTPNTLMANVDALFSRDSAATIQLGIDASTATTQTLKAHDGSGTDKAGATLQLRAGQSTGTGRGGDMATATSLTAASTGSSANSYSTRSYSSAKWVDLTESTATLFANISLTTNNYVGAMVQCTVTANDGTNFQAIHSTLNIAGVNKAGTVTATLTQGDGTTAASSGTLSVTYTAVANGNGIDIKASAVSSLTQTVLRCKWMITALNSDGVATVTAQ